MATGAQAGRQASLPPGWSSIDIPEIGALAGAAGLPAPVERARLVLEAARLAYGDPPGRDAHTDAARARLQAVLQLDELGHLSTRVRVPLPLTPGTWIGTVFAGVTVDERTLGRAILADPTAALLYHGLYALDAPTLAYLADTSNGALATCREAARPFAVFGRSLHIRDGRVDVPGGADAVALWEDLAGARVTQPATFLRNLFLKEHGWLACFYDVLAHLDPPHLAFALGAGSPDVRRARFRTLFASAVRGDPAWTPAERPFVRPAIDAARLLGDVAVTGAGVMEGPATRTLWDAVFLERAVPSAAPVDAAYLGEHVLAVTPRQRQARYEAVRFAQRVFARADAAALPDVVSVLRRMPRTRALVLTLERLGIRDPSVYAAVVDLADRLTEASNRTRAISGIVQMQAGLAILDRLVVRHAMSHDAAARLVVALTRVVADGDRFGGRLAPWVKMVLASMPPPARVAATAAGDEEMLLAHLAGPAALPGATGSAVPWEGEVYHLDLGAAEFARLRLTRRLLGGNGLDAALALATLATGSVRPADIVAAAARVREMGSHWEPVTVAGLPPMSAREIERAAAPAAARGRGGTLAPAQASLLAAADAVLADSLARVVYAVHLADPDSLVFAAGDVVGAHDLSLPVVRGPEPPAGPWAVANELRGGGIGWHLVGSLLALDVPLAYLRLHRMTSAPPAAPPTLDAQDAMAFAQAAALVDPYALSDDGRDRLARALATGRARVDALVRNGEMPASAAAADVIREAGLSEWRSNGLQWALAEEPDAVESWFTRAELLRLSGLEPAGAAWLDAWGTSAYPVDGRLGLRFPGRQPWEESAGRMALGLLPTRLPDLTLRLVEWLADLRLPAALLPGVLASATEDLLDEARPSDGWDALTLARLPDLVTRQRFEDYVSALTAAGPLVPGAAPGSASARSGSPGTPAAPRKPDTRFDP